MKTRIPDGEWELECSADQFAVLRTDKEFAFLLTLARVVNALKFGVEAYGGAQSMSPMDERHRVGAFMYLSAVLHEVLELKKSAEKEWGDLPFFTQVFAALDENILDKKTGELLNKIRNRAAFHFDPTVAARTLPRLPAEPFVFITAIGRNRMNSNYELADIITFGFVFDAPADVDSLSKRLSEFRPRLDTLLRDFIKAVDDLVLQRLLAKGLRIVERPSGYFKSEREPDEQVPGDRAI